MRVRIIGTQDALNKQCISVGSIVPGRVYEATKEPYSIYYNVISDVDGFIWSINDDCIQEVSEMATTDDLIAALGAPNRSMSAAERAAMDAVLSGNTDFAAQINAAEEKKALEEQKKMMKSLSVNQILLSTITGGRLPKSKKDYVIDVYPAGTWPKDMEIDIPEVDKDHYWDADLLEALIISLKLGERMLLVGLPGCGKTTSLKQLAAWIRQPFARFNGKGGIEPASFLGYSWADVEIVKGTAVPVMKWKDGLMPQAVREGYMVVIDEVFKLTPDIQMALQSLYEKDGFLMLDDKPGTIAEKHIYPGKNFHLFCTDNTCGTGDNLDMFAASQMQDTSTLDRFGMTKTVDYLPLEAEVQMLCNKFPSVAKETVKRLVRFAGLIRTAYKNASLPVTLSPRGLSAICGLNEFLPIGEAIKLAFTNKLGTDSHRIQAEELERTVWKGVA